MGLSRIERKILGVIKTKFDGVTFEIRKITPDDFLDKEGIPISKWQVESELMFKRKSDGDLSLKEIRKSWIRLFSKAIISIDGQSKNLDGLINSIMENIELSNSLYNEIINHCFNKKKMRVFGIFPRFRLW